ncbi:MAG: hypothetical protein LBC91_03135 [Candidatus Accumulibacter sp.]|nr:hypothetical protein [Accumulibacter sp.]
MSKEASKSKNLLFAGLYIAKKDRQSLPFFGVKTGKPHGRTGFAFGLHDSNPRQTGKKLELFFDVFKV